MLRLFNGLRLCFANFSLQIMNRVFSKPTNLPREVGNLDKMWVAISKRIFGIRGYFCFCLKTILRKIGDEKHKPPAVFKKWPVVEFATATGSLTESRSFCNWRNIFCATQTKNRTERKSYVRKYFYILTQFSNFCTLHLLSNGYKGIFTWG